jgi:hypothetical protein
MIIPYALAGMSNAEIINMESGTQELRNELTIE